MAKTTKRTVARHVRKIYEGTIAGKIGSKAKKRKRSMRQSISSRNKALSDVMKSMR